MNTALAAVLLGVATQSSLLISGLAVYWIHLPTRVVGWLAGFGAGALIGAVAFDLLPESMESGLGIDEVGLWLLIGGLVFVVGDRLVEQRFGGEAGGGALGIVLGAFVDGIPESIILGIQLAAGIPVSIAFVFAVWISNVPQAVAPSADLAAAGWTRLRMAAVWGGVVVASGVAAAAGFWVASLTDDAQGARMAALAAGGLLAMLTDSLMPFAYERAGRSAGLGTILGMAVSLAML
jgi:ZIP family zinc transporter